MLVLDASVYVATVVDTDRYHDRSRRWLEARLREKERLVAPNLFVVEVAAAIRRLSGNRAVAERTVSRMLEKAFIELVPLTADRTLRAVEAAAMTGVRGADAVYLALARELDAPLVTLDRQQLERGKEIATVRRPWSE